MTPFLALFVALDDTARKNQYFIDPTYKYFGIMQVQYLVISKTATASGGHDKRVSDTLSTVLRRKYLLPPAHASILADKLFGQQTLSSWMLGPPALGLWPTLGCRPPTESPECYQMGPSRTLGCHI